ncbi:TPA: glycogen synthase GlgA [Streptococcus equi subsp. zooepidemicus]|uniref:glycogen synthase GlgA n=1 Tax=Streptococcus equi TaxID=1336 RepID=UPI0002E3695B|nr:glycogen synthase GlgA [Streptococcus equi]MCD3371603.1 glycogen synthase GlgA [Streptococcus equi subsp. zooepidemicus]HEL0144191.1 glycogen synthase GlgA [Streptococcus equi subsp. zooepidemicus]HEL0164538.1 glycogen synthase GlgA [Streptococcus equi subsp. zooepidemicus]HEL0170636.1 glycogen synthase GlgA [Streptococcus equi subsp. zooepidemicus]HEL0174200.1 glycogen synthase GlgA [Streptococcus equi subsp. zooepidemicus]
MKIMFVAAEGAPFAKTGGLGDVIGALPKSLVKNGHEVFVILPYYDVVDQAFGHQVEDVLYFYTQVGWRRQYVGIKRLVKDKVTFYFIDNQAYFFRGRIYGDWDDGERFAYFQLAAIEAMEKIGVIPDILHVHDYHTAMIPFLLKEKYHWIQAYQAIRTVFTIHNIAFQGQFDAGMLGDLFGVGMERYEDGTLRWHDGLNWMKAAVLYADRVTTVSPSYAHEIQTPAFGKGLDQVMRMEAGKLSGIVNGIDTDLFNPARDPHLPAPFSAKDLSGKAATKQALQERLGLPVRADVPLIGMVSRLTDQKGFQLVLEELSHILQQDVQLVLLGTGDPDYEAAFAWFAKAYPEKLSANITFDLPLAQHIYGACDLFLMPSAFEPCGLSQMMAMRYGAIPIVHEIGGLKDTVAPYNAYEKTGTGFGFDQFSGFWLTQTLLFALNIYHNHKEDWQTIQQNAMTKDFSWDTASLAYLDLYKSLL